MKNSKNSNMLAVEIEIIFDFLYKIIFIDSIHSATQKNVKKSAIVSESLKKLKNGTIFPYCKTHYIMC